MTLPSSVRSRVSFLFQPRARRISVLLALLIGLAFLSSFTTFRTRLVFTNQDGRLILTANGKTIQGVGRIDRINRIAIRVFSSVFPMGGETLRIWQDGRIVFEDELPDRFRMKRGAYAPLGDWSIDPFAGSDSVYERELGLTGDFTLEVTFKGRCTEWTSVMLQGQPSSVVLQFRRGLLNNDFALTVRGRLLALDVLTSPLSLMALNALDIVLHALMAGCILVLLFTLIHWLSGISRDHPLRGALDKSLGALRRHWVVFSVALVVLVALFGRLSVSEKILEGLAHTPDEVSYLLQSKWLVANRLYQPASAIQEHLAVPFTYVRDGKWFSMYPIGWPLLLAIGEAAGLPQIVSPVLGAIYVLLVFLIGKELYGKLVGLAAALLAALSPMAVLMSASYLSHSPAALTIALFLWLFLVARRRRSLSLFGLSGASLGYAFGIRPVTAVAIAVPFALLIVWELVRSSERPLLLRSNAAFAVGFVIGALPVLIANHLITGSALSFAYSYGAGISFSLKNLPIGLMYLDATTASVLPAIFGWGWGILSGWLVLSLTLAFACVPFLIRRPGRFEVLLGAMFLVLPLSFLAWGFHGLHGYGPRFYFEAFLGIYLLTARGFFLLGGIDSERGGGGFRWGRGVALLSVGLLLLLVLSTALTLPSRMRLYRGYNGVSSALEAAISREKIHRALILFPDDSWFPWGAASNLLPADLHGDLAFAVSRPDNSKLAAFYPDRPAYMWFGNLTPMRLPSGVPPLPPESRRAPPGLTTLLGWWIALSAAAVGLFIAVARGSTRPSDSGFPPDPLRPAKRLRDLVRRRSVRLRVLPRRRALVGLLAVLVAYAGQSILVPNRLTHRLSLPGISSGPWFHVGWILLTLGAVVFAVAWRGIDPDELESAATSRGDEGEKVVARGSADAPFHPQTRSAGFDGPVSKYEPVSATEVEPSRSESGF
ncbi:MAG TPA: glycosyltransferase family 39 protein, partial [Thermoanaerobaculia bacterium]